MAVVSCTARPNPRSCTGQLSACFAFPPARSQTPSTAGVQPGDMLILVQPQQAAPGRQGLGGGGGGRAQQPGAGGSAQQAAMLRNPDGTLVNPAAAIQAFKSDTNMMDQVWDGD